MREFASLARTGFEYSEPAEPENFATSASSNLPFYEPAQWLAGPATVAPGGEPDVRRLLEACAEPANAMITLIARANEPQATLQEPIYGTKYGKLPLGREVAAWRTAPIPPELGVPPPNPFVPQDFAIRAQGKRAPPPSDCLLYTSPSPRDS